MTSIDTQIFLAWCEYRRYGPGTVTEYREWRAIMLRYYSLIHMWLMEPIR